MNEQNRKRSLGVTLGALVVLGAASAFVPACTKSVPTAAQPCPCASGYVCCESGVCAQGAGACGVATSALSLAAQGHWVGYVENYTALASRSDTLDISLEVDAAGELHGRMKLGDAAAPPPATNGAKTWPPGVHYFLGRAGKPEVTPLEGFAYEALNVRWQARRLRFEALYSEPWKPWCELQTSAPTENDDYSCFPTAARAWGELEGTSPNPDGSRHCHAANTGDYDCDVLQLCASAAPICACTASGCTNHAGKTFVFDIALDEDKGSGSMDTFNVRLTRAAD
jgi:hypothetical protein